jgi:hypothetical protein
LWTLVTANQAQSDNDRHAVEPRGRNLRLCAKVAEMKRFLAGLAFSLALLHPAFAQNTKAQMTTEIGVNLPDNTTGLITPLGLRTTTTDMVNSWQQAPRFGMSAAPPIRSPWTTRGTRSSTRCHPRSRLDRTGV